jgi:hypothetical protein
MLSIFFFVPHLFCEASVSDVDFVVINYIYYLIFLLLFSSLSFYLNE